MLIPWLVWGLACNWEPIAREVQPEQVLVGDYRIASVLDKITNRYVLLVQRNTEPRRYVILDMHERSHCQLPEGTTSITMLTPPTTSPPKDAPPFKMALQVDDGARAQFYLSTPDCTLTGPFGEVGDGRKDGPFNITMEADQRSVVMWISPSGQLSFRDPWFDEQHVIAENVAIFDTVARPSRPAGQAEEQALWLIENGRLVQRTFGGKVLLAIGKDVQDFTQAVFDTVRVAYQDGQRLFEAAGPQFTPFLVAEDGCSPRYSGNTLSLLSPCADEQLLRLDLITGTVQEFAPGVFWSYTSGTAVFEQSRDMAGDEHLFVTLQGRERTEIKPLLNRYIDVIDPTHVAGRTPDRRFGVWSPDEGFKVLFNGVVDLTPFIDLRTNSYLWLMLHEASDDLGTLSVFDQKDYKLKKLATNVPTSGYSVETIETLGEPIVVSLENAAADGGGVRTAELRARLLSGELGSSIDSKVTSYTMLAVPVPGLLYTIDEPARRGLWFAAL
jgi:hypothetical protein